MSLLMLCVVYGYSLGGFLGAGRDVPCSLIGRLLVIYLSGHSSCESE